MARKPPGKARKETRADVRARKAMYQRIHESAVWVLPTVISLFVVIFVFLFWVASRPSAPAAAGGDAGAAGTQ
uniref:Uncharacterized protein n=1 Tax=Tetraselmis sp. GSL018 TaxID=582737 RepID=A0A061S4P7_9CHLO